MQALAQPSSSRKNADSASIRTWNGRSGRPSGRTISRGASASAIAAKAASNTPAMAPAGKNTRTTRRSRGLIMQIAPSASQATTMASTPCSASNVPVSGTSAILVRDVAGALVEEPRRQLASAGVPDHVLADQPAHHLRRRQVLRRADFLEQLLLS